ncbi:MAG: hypothetical protein ABSF77_03120 [Spirochaetia bacterium]
MSAPHKAGPGRGWECTVVESSGPLSESLESIHSAIGVPTVGKICARRGDRAIKRLRGRSVALLIGISRGGVIRQAALAEPSTVIRAVCQ